MALLIAGGQVLRGTPPALERADVLVDGDRITDVAPGTYSLEVETNPQHLLLETDYSNNVASNLVVIPHGAVTAKHTGGTSGQAGGRPMILTWGLLGRGKGIEWAIPAIAGLRGLAPARTPASPNRSRPAKMPGWLRLGSHRHRRNRSARSRISPNVADGRPRVESATRSAWIASDPSTSSAAPIASASAIARRAVAVELSDSP